MEKSNNFFTFYSHFKQILHFFLFLSNCSVIFLNRDIHSAQTYVLGRYDKIGNGIALFKTVF